MIPTRFALRALLTLTTSAVIASAVYAAAAAGHRNGGVHLSGPHANDEFCRVMVAQYDAIEHFDPLDAQSRVKYFADQRDLNAKLVRTAPARLANDVRLQTTNANAMLDAQNARDTKRMKASARILGSPANVAASKRIAAYCGATYSD